MVSQGSWLALFSINIVHCSPTYFQQFLMCNAIFHRVLHQVECLGSLGLNFDYDGGPIIENGGTIFFCYMTGENPVS